MASSVTRTATSDAFHFDIEPSAFLNPPLRASHAARQINRRLASTSAITFANYSAIAWFMMIGLPNA